MSILNNTNGSIKIYAAGGCGINVGKHFDAMRTHVDFGYATIDTTLIDTSTSNLHPDLDKDSIYLIEGLDGSGKVRAENHEIIGECVLDILQKHKPADLNIVLSSASGGSGSVISPSLVNELLSRGLPTIVFIVGTTDSGKELENTIKTLKSYEAIAQNNERPVVAAYFENSKESQRQTVNGQIQFSITLLAALFSRQNDELDSSDLNNWLNYNKVTSFDPHLSHLEFFSKDIDMSKPESIITVASLGTIDDKMELEHTVEYRCNGFIQEAVKPAMQFKLPVHYAVVDGFFTETHKRLSAKLSALDDVKKARISKNTLLTDKDKPTKNGLVL